MFSAIQKRRYSKLILNEKIPYRRRISKIWKLGRNKSNWAISLLCEFSQLKHVEFKIFHEVILSLGKTQSEIAFEHIMNLLNRAHQDYWTDRGACYQALTNFLNDSSKHHQIIEALKKGLSDPSSSYRLAAVKSLDIAKWKPNTKEEEAIYLIGQNQWEEIKKLGHYAAKILLEILEFHYQNSKHSQSYFIFDETKKDYRQIIIALKNTSGAKELPKLWELAKDGLTEAFEIICSIKEPQANQYILEACKVNRFRTKAVTEMVERKDLRCLPCLREICCAEADKVPCREAKAFFEIAQIEDKETIMRLISSMHKSALPRSEAFSAIRRIGIKHFVSDLISLLDHNDEGIRGDTIVLLSEFEGIDPVDYFIKILKRPRDSYTYDLGKVFIYFSKYQDNRAYEALLNVFENLPSGTARYEAVQTLASYPNVKTVEFFWSKLIPLPEDGDVEKIKSWCRSGKKGILDALEKVILAMPDIISDEILIGVMNLPKPISYEIVTWDGDVNITVNKITKTIDFSSVKQIARQIYKERKSNDNQ